MEKNYALALWKFVEKGNDPHKAVHALSESLSKSGRATLMPRILGAFKKIAERNALQNQDKIFVAREKDAHKAKEISGAPGAKVIVDPTLIGGWRLEAGEKLVDASFKKYLLEMYNRAVA